MEATVPEPLSRNISLTVHETVYPLIKTAANEDRDGNVNEYVRMLVYRDLRDRGLLTAEKAIEVMI